MARFADKLDFGSDTARVVANANRVAQRMDRDWIVRYFLVKLFTMKFLEDVDQLVFVLHRCLSLHV
jgi:hypothetical protein